MALSNIKVWSDDEVITHTDLNSIGTAVSQELGSSNISSTSLVWPLVAQGAIDMNGNEITNIGEFLGEVHVNQDLTLTAALTAPALTSDTVIIIDNDAPASSLTLNGVTISGLSDITIKSHGPSIKVTVSGSITDHGLRVDSDCTNINIENIRFTGGAAGYPNVLIAGGAYHTVKNCQFDTCTGVGLQIGTASTDVNYGRVESNIFNDCTQKGLNILGGGESVFSLNIFQNNTLTAMEIPGDADNNFHHNVIIGNAFRSGTTAIHSDGWTAAATTNMGQNSYIGNTFHNQSSKSVEIDGYFQDTFIGNEMYEPAVLGPTQGIITGNTFYNTLVYDGTKSTFTNNTFGNTVSSDGTGTNTAFIGNAFVTIFELDTWIGRFIGNRLDASVTETGMPTEYALNEGWS